MSKQCHLQNQPESAGLNPTPRHRGAGRSTFLGKDDPALTFWFLKDSYYLLKIISEIKMHKYITAEFLVSVEILSM